MISNSNRQLVATRNIIFLVGIIASTVVAASSSDDRNESNRAAKKSVPTFNTQPNLSFAIDKFWGVGTAATNQFGQIVVGDYVGYDGSDTDGDGNVENVWFAGTPIGGNDSDLLISKRAFLGDLRLTFDACIGVTHYSYQYVAVGFSNPSFTGQPGTATTNPPAYGYEIGFMTRWEDPSAVHIWRDSAATTPLSSNVGPTLTADGFCAAYEIKRRNGQVYASVNGTLVFTGPAFAATGPAAIFVRTWDSPIKLWNVEWRAIKTNEHDEDEDD